MAAPASTLTQVNPGAQDTAYNALISYDSLGSVGLPGTLDTPQFNAPAYDNTGVVTPPDLTTTGAAGGGAAAPSGGSLSSLLSSLSSGLSSPLGELALFGGAAAGLSSQASSAAAENNALAQQISSIGQPFVSAGTGQLTAYEQGQLTQPFQTQLTAALTANQQTATSQMGAVATALAGSSGGQNLSGALTSQTAAIQNAQNLANQTAVANAFSGELSAATGLLGAGGGFVQQGILSEIQNNQNLQQTLMGIFSGLASAYAQSTGGGGGTTGTGTTGSAVGNLGQNVGNLINDLTGNTGTSALTSSLQGTVNQTLASDVANQGGYGLASDLGDTTFTNAAGSAASDSSILGDIGYFNAAGGEAAAGAGAGAAGALAGGDLTALGTGASLSIDPAAAAAVDAAAAGGAGGAGALATIGAVAPEVLAAAGVAYGLYDLLKPAHTQETITNPNEPSSTTIKLQSGNSALLSNTATPAGQQPTSGVAFGAGTSRGQGSAQWFLVPAASGTIQKTTGSNAGGIGAAQAGQPTVQKGVPFYIGTQASQDLTNFANSVPLVNGKPNFSSYLAQYQATPNANTGLIGVYNNNGGQAGWGMNYSQWLQSIWNAKNGVTGNLST